MDAELREVIFDFLDKFSRDSFIFPCLNYISGLKKAARLTSNAVVIE